MKNVKTLIIITLSFLLLTKVSGKSKGPDWISNPEPGYFVAKGMGISKKQSKAGAVDSATEMITRLAIDNMLKQSSFFKNNNISTDSVREVFKGSPLYEDYSEIKIKSVYCEKAKAKKPNKKNYLCYIKFPFDKEEFSEAIRVFVSDYELTATLGMLSERLKEYKTIRELSNIWQELMFLTPKFSDDDIRKIKCDETMSKVEAGFNNIVITEKLNTPGKLIVTQTLNDRALISLKPPTIKSNCARILNVEKYEEQWAIEYSYSQCKRSQKNAISVEFDNNFNKSSKDVFFNAAEESVEVELSRSKITITKSGLITIFISSRYRGNILLDKIILRYNDLNFTETQLNQELKGAGLYNISFNLPHDFNKVNVDKAIRGELYFKSQKTGQKGVYRFYNQEVAFRD